MPIAKRKIPPGFELNKGRWGALRAKAKARMAPVCVLCGNAPLYRVGRKGYCKVHAPDAQRHQQTKNHHMEQALSGLNVHDWADGPDPTMTHTADDLWPTKGQD